MKKAAFILAIFYTVLMTVFAAVSGSWEVGVVANLPNAAPWLFSWVSLIIAWKNPRSGGILYIISALASIFFFHTYNELGAFLIVTLPLFIIGASLLHSHTHGEPDGVDDDGTQPPAPTGTT